MKFIKYIKNLESLIPYFENNQLNVKNIVKQLNKLKENSEQKEEKIAGKIVKFRKGIARRKEAGNWIIKNNPTDTGEIAYTIFQALISLNVINAIIDTAEWKDNSAESGNQSFVITTDFYFTRRKGTKFPIHLIIDGKEEVFKGKKELEKRLEELNLKEQTLKKLLYKIKTNLSTIMPSTKDYTSQNFKTGNEPRVLFLHGFPGNPSLDKSIQLEKEGFKVINKKILWGKAFSDEQIKPLIKYLSLLAKKCDVIIGTSFGGYIAFLLTSKTKTPCILINPVISLDRIKEGTGEQNADPKLKEKNLQEYENNKVKITSHFAEISHPYPSENEIFFGGGDTIVKASETLEDLKKLGISDKFNKIYIKNMGHGINQTVRHDEPTLFNKELITDKEWGVHDHFFSILNQSKIIKKIINNKLKK